MTELDFSILEKTGPGSYYLSKELQPANFLKIKENLDSHKGNYDHVAILEGSENTAGAAHLAAIAALRAGASLVTKLSEDKKNYKSEDFPELMFQQISLKTKSENFKKYSIFIIGPGLGISQKKQELAKYILTIASRLNKPVVLDAEGLFLLKDKDILELSKTKKLNIIATPHPGEAGKLLNLTAKQIQSNRLQACQKLLDLKINNNQNNNITWLLKGSEPIVFRNSLNKNNFITIEGKTPELSIGGSGDVLSGAIAACNKQTKNLLGACVLGATKHQATGRFLASELAKALQK